MRHVLMHRNINYMLLHNILLKMLRILWGLNKCPFLTPKRVPQKRPLFRHDESCGFLLVMCYAHVYATRIANMIM